MTCTFHLCGNLFDLMRVNCIIVNICSLFNPLSYHTISCIVLCLVCITPYVGMQTVVLLVLITSLCILNMFRWVSQGDAHRHGHRETGEGRSGGVSAPILQTWTGRPAGEHQEEGEFIIHPALHFDCCTEIQCLFLLDHYVLLVGRKT